jgi:hypothetical protein
MECPIQPDRQNQRERIPRATDFHGYYILVDVQVDSISDSAEYIGKKYPIYRQTGKTREKEFTEGWTLQLLRLHRYTGRSYISDSAEYIGMECPYSQTDKTREKEFTEGWTFTAITSS